MPRSWFLLERQVSIFFCWIYKYSAVCEFEASAVILLDIYMCVCVFFVKLNIKWASNLLLHAFRAMSHSMAYPSIHILYKIHLPRKLEKKKCISTSDSFGKEKFWSVFFGKEKTSQKTEKCTKNSPLLKLFWKFRVESCPTNLLRGIILFGEKPIYSSLSTSAKWVELRFRIFCAKVMKFQ